MKFLSRLIINTLLFIALAGFFPNNFYIENLWFALIGAFILTFLTLFIKPIISLFLLPFNILTFGIVGILVNSMMLNITANLIGDSFQFSSFGFIIFVSLIMSFCNYVIISYLKI
ncbi:phage holin family protein [Lactobacillus sp. S2-2]|uniref:phage holin family protein n=1 Tax=Lactobacillus sp. S2-2 TaxID=2692917 RepID=UPI001F2149F5|nr:phage holin family protein [Lactobacillus sp. S2-2]MCF6515686.1 phage holin family protein [Lactobacillus sp. S2-2]